MFLCPWPSPFLLAEIFLVFSFISLSFFSYKFFSLFCKGSLRARATRKLEHQWLHFDSGLRILIKLVRLNRIEPGEAARWFTDTVEGTIRQQTWETAQKTEHSSAETFGERHCCQGQPDSFLGAGSRRCGPNSRPPYIAEALAGDRSRRWKWDFLNLVT